MQTTHETENGAKAGNRTSAIHRCARLLVGLMAFAMPFGGAKAAPVSRELNAQQLEQALQDKSSALSGFVQKVENEMIGGRMDWFEGAIDRQGILARATAGVKCSDLEMIRGLFTQGTERAWDEQGISRDFAGTNFRFLRVRTFKDRAGLVFRSVGSAGALNFYSLAICKDAGGDLRVSDIYTVGLNEYTSESLNRTFRHLASSFQDEATDEDDGAFVANLKTIAGLNNQLHAGKWKEVLDGIAQLPESLQRDRGVLLVRLEAAENYSITDRAEALEAWLQVYPDEMELPLKFMDHYMLQERWDDAERVISGLLGKVGEDSRLLGQLGTVKYRRNRDQSFAQVHGNLSTPGTAAAR